MKDRSASNTLFRREPEPDTSNRVWAGCILWLNLIRGQSRPTPGDL